MDSMRTHLNRARGLGSAKEGANHFIQQRVSALALIVLVVWFLISIITTITGGYDATVTWISNPINATLLIALLGTGLFHMRLGMQTVIEDYIGRPATKIILLVGSTFFCALLGVVSVLSVVKIFAGA